MPATSRKILAAVDDLFFTVKISDAAKRAGLGAAFVKTETEVLERARTERPLMVIVDLNARLFDPVKVIAGLKSDAALKGLSIVAFVSHVEADLKQRAQTAGASMVMARSAFSTNLPQILKRHTGAY
jgi:PleD family two-component response regulator